MSEQNIATAIKFLNAMGEGDVEVADACVGPDAVAVAKGYGKLSGVRRRESMVGNIAGFKQLFPTGLKLDYKSITANADRVVIECEGNALTCTDKPYKNQYCMVFTMTDGKISRLNEYFCTVHADEVVWPIFNQHVDDQAS